MANIQNILNKLPSKVSNTITNWATKSVSIANWDNRLLGIASYPIRTIIDIGANEGQATLKFHRIFPEATIYAFEPSNLPFKKLAKIAEVNQNIIAFNYALGHIEDQVILNDYVGATQASSMLQVSTKAKEQNPVLKRVELRRVAQKTLDSLELKISTDLFVKIDVQGYELQVIRGGLNTLSQAKACIVEINNEASYEAQCSFKEIFHTLDQLGFCYQGNIDQILDPLGKVQYFDAVFLKNY